jgi:glycosyltransferase involved in cell wall biosynthesis
MPPVRLLELRTTYKWGGGPDKTILLSASRHDPQRVSVVVAYVRGAHDYEFAIADKARALGLTFYEIEERGKFDLRVLGAIRDIIIEHDINLIHAHDYKTDLFAYIVRALLRRRALSLHSTAHGWALLGTRGELYRRLDLFLLRRFDHVLAVSHATKNGLTSAGIPPTSISVLHNAIDTETWSPSRGHPGYQEGWGSVSYFPIIGYVGRITPEKDLHTWLRVAALVAQQFPHARFVLVGDGKDEVLLKELQHQVGALGIAKQVVFHGYQESPLNSYRTFDIFLLTSTTEGLSNSLLEAMAMGLPTVVTRVGGNEELVADGHTGYVLSAGDVHGLAQAIITLAQNEQLRRAMGQAGRERIEHAFSFIHRLQRIESLYEHLVGAQSTVISSPSTAVLSSSSSTTFGNK